MVTPVRVDSPSGGFTIVEVILFLALTGLIMLIAINGVNARQRQTQFADAMRTLEDYLQGEYTAVVNGVNLSQPGDYLCAAAGGGTRASASGLEDKCVFLGKIIEFQDNSKIIKSHIITANRLWGDDLTSGKSDWELIEESMPRVSRTDTYEIAWGAHYKHLTHNTEGGVNNDGKDTIFVGILKSPLTGQVKNFVIYFGTQLADKLIAGDPTYIDAINFDQVSLGGGGCNWKQGDVFKLDGSYSCSIIGFAGRYCIASADESLHGGILYSNREQAGAIETVFDTSDLYMENDRIKTFIDRCKET